VVEDEHLVAEHGKAVEVFRTFLMRDGGDGSLQLSHMRLQRDGYLVAEAALYAGADGTKEPCGGGR
jgi:hypothetical protein